MSGVEPNKIDFQGIKLISEDETQSITFKMDGTNKGIILDYDLLTTPKQFQITPTGVEYTDGVNTYNTGLERIALVQQAFQAVELPPNATTLQLNNTLYLTDGVSNTTYGIGVIDTTGVGMSIIAPNANIYLGDVNGTANSTAISIDDTAKIINLTTDNGTIGGYCNIFQVGDVNGNINSTKIELDDSGKTIYQNALQEVIIGDIFNASPTPYPNSKVAIDIANGVVDCNSVFQTRLGDCYGSGNNQKIIIDNDTRYINIEAPNGQVVLGDPNGLANSGTLTFDDAGNSFGVAFQSTANILLDCNTGVFSCGDINVVGNGTRIELNDPNSSLSLISGGNPVKLNTSASVQYSTNYYTTSQTITNIYPYSLTFDGVGLVAFLPIVSSVEVGIQFLITNVNSNVLSVIAQGSQLIYSSVAPNVVGNRNLNNGHSQLFTAIRTGASSYGWSMV